MEEVDLSPAAPALVPFAQRGSQLEQPLATREQELQTLQHTVASCTPSTQSSSVAAVPAPEVDAADVKDEDTWDDIALADSPKARPKSLFPVALPSVRRGSVPNLRATPPAGRGSSSVGGRPSSLRESESSGGRSTPISACEPPTATGGSRRPMVRTITASVSVDKLRTVSAKVVSTVSASASSAAAAAKPAAERARTSARTIVSEVSILSKAATAAAQAGALAAKDPEAAAAAARRDNYASHACGGPAASSAEDAEASRESLSGLRVISGSASGSASGGASGSASGTMADGMLPSPSCSTTSSLGIRIGLRPEGIARAAERPWVSALDLGDVELDDYDDPSDAVDVASPDADDGGDVEAATAELNGSASLAATRPSSGRFLSVAVQSTPPPLPVKAFRLNGFHTEPLGETIDESSRLDHCMLNQSPRLPMPKAPAPVRETRPLSVRFAQLRASATDGWQTTAASLRECMHGVLTTRTRRRDLQGQMRSVTAVEGLALLKRGSVATKYSRHGKQRRTRFTLSADERTLSWERKGVSDKQAAAQDGAHGKCAALGTALMELIVDSARDSAEWLGQRRSIAIADVLEVLVGQQSANFIKHRHRTALQKQAATAAHLSLTLVLVTAFRTR